MVLTTQLKKKIINVMKKFINDFFAFYTFLSHVFDIHDTKKIFYLVFSVVNKKRKINLYFYFFAYFFLHSFTISVLSAELGPMGNFDMPPKIDSFVPMTPVDLPVLAVPALPAVQQPQGAVLGVQPAAQAATSVQSTVTSPAVATQAPAAQPSTFQVQQAVQPATAHVTEQPSGSVAQQPVATQTPLGAMPMAQSAVPQAQPAPQPVATYVNGQSGGAVVAPIAQQAVAIPVVAQTVQPQGVVTQAGPLIPGSPAALQQIVTLKAELDIKKSIELKPEYYGDCLKILIQAVPLAATFPADEQNPKNPNSFLSKIKKLVPLLYSKRAQKTVEELTNLKLVLEQTKTAPLFADLVKEPWIPSVTLLLALQNLNKKEIVLEKIQEVTRLVDVLVKTIDPYEITRLATVIIDLFMSRAAYSSQELQALLDLLQKSVSPAVQEKKLFTKQRIDRWAVWVTIVTTLKTLQETQNDFFYWLEPLLNALTDNDAMVERKCFATILSDYFFQRGSMTRKSLDDFKNLLMKTKRLKKVFSSAQESTVNLWIQELTEAIKVTPVKDGVYIEGLITQGFSNDNFGALAKAISLFVEKTPMVLKNLLITKLNILLAQQQDDPVLSKNEKRVKKLIELLKFLRDKQVQSKGPLLNDQQKNGVDEWISRLKAQIEKKEQFVFDKKTPRLE